MVRRPLFFWFCMVLAVCFLVCGNIVSLCNVGSLGLGVLVWCVCGMSEGSVDRLIAIEWDIIRDLERQR